MIFVIGGYSQGKLDYVKKRFMSEEINIMDAAELIIDAKSEYFEISSAQRVIINNINTAIADIIKNGKSPEDAIKKMINDYPDAVILSDEVGNGIVPIDKSERLIREKIGRVQCLLAKEAEEVIRVICGIGQKIK